MIEPLYTLDDFLPWPNADFDFGGWRFVHYDPELGHCILQVVPSSRETVVYYPQEDETLALIIDDETAQIVGVQIENYDPKALR